MLWSDLVAKWRQNCFLGTFGKSIETPNLSFLKGLKYLLIFWTNYNKQEQNWKTSDKMPWNSWTVCCELILHHIILNWVLSLWYFRHTENDVYYRLLGFYGKILQQIETLYQCPNFSFHQMPRISPTVCYSFFFFIVEFVNTIACYSCINYIGNNWCCLRKFCEIQAYWFFMSFS